MYVGDGEQMNGQVTERWWAAGVLVFLLTMAALLMPVFLLQVTAQRVQPGYGAEETATRMPTLQDVYERLDTGATATPATNFSGPTTGPTVASSLSSINSIVPLLPTVSGSCAIPSGVESGTTFYSLCASTFGQTLTGTASASDGILLATGQNTCYNAGGSVISCAGTGQDGEYQNGRWITSGRFTDNGNGSVTDNLTELVWLKDANCSATLGGITKTTTLIWEDSIKWSNALASGSCGLTDGSVAGDWRLPNRRELLSLVDYQRSNPSLPTGHPFTSVVNSSYWSSTTGVVNPDVAWFVLFITGNSATTLKTGDRYVWPVR